MVNRSRHEKQRYLGLDDWSYTTLASKHTDSRWYFADPDASRFLPLLGGLGDYAYYFKRPAEYRDDGSLTTGHDTIRDRMHRTLRHKREAMNMQIDRRPLKKDGNAHNTGVVLPSKALTTTVSQPALGAPFNVSQIVQSNGVVAKGATPPAPPPAPPSDPNDFTIEDVSDNWDGTMPTSTFIPMVGAGAAAVATAMAGATAMIPGAIVGMGLAAGKSTLDYFGFNNDNASPPTTTDPVETAKKAVGTDPFGVKAAVADLPDFSAGLQPVSKAASTIAGTAQRLGNDLQNIGYIIIIIAGAYVVFKVLK